MEKNHEYMRVSWTLEVVTGEEELQQVGIDINHTSACFNRILTVDGPEPKWGHAWNNTKYEDKELLEILVSVIDLKNSLATDIAVVANAFSKQGWKLHSVLHFGVCDGSSILLER